MAIPESTRLAPVTVGLPSPRDPNLPFFSSSSVFLSSASHHQPSCSCISKHGLATTHLQLHVHAQRRDQACRRGSPTPSKNIMRSLEKSPPRALTTKGGLEICPSSVELMSVKNMNTGVKSVSNEWDEMSSIEEQRRPPKGTLVKHGLTHVNGRT